MNIPALTTGFVYSPIRQSILKKIAMPGRARAWRLTEKGLALGSATLLRALGVALEEQRLTDHG
jgi:hypothetical protein